MTILRETYEKISRGGVLSWSNADCVLITDEKVNMFAQYQYSLMYADVDEEGFDTLLEEHPGVLSNINTRSAKLAKRNFKRF